MGILTDSYASGKERFLPLLLWATLLPSEGRGTSDFMKIVTWNVNSIKARREHVEDYLDRIAPDVLCLQELKCVDEMVPREIFESRGYFVESHGQKTYNGVLIASMAPLEDVHRGLEGGDEGQARLIAATTYGTRIVNLYCPQGSDVESPKFAYKLGFYDVLNPWLGQEIAKHKDVIALGDFNIAPHPDDVWDVEEMTDQVSYHPLEHKAWAELLALGFFDSGKPFLPSRTFTFWDYRQMSFRRKRGMRIDHVVATEELHERAVAAEVHRDERKKEKPSDHAPLMVTFE